MSKTVFITGCSEGGLGFGLAKEYHERGHRVFASARSRASMNALKAMGIETFVLDVINYANICQVQDVIAERTGGKLDILINNAGVPSSAPLAEQSTEGARSVFDVNIFGVMEVTRVFIPLLMNSHGSIIPVGSIAAVLHMPFNGVYNMTKAALVSYGDTLRVELAPFNVKVQVIFSGTVKTNFAKPELFKLAEGSMYTPIKKEREDVIKMVNEGTMPLSVWASRVVTESLKPPTKFKAHLWMGPAKSMWAIWISTFFWRTFLDPISSKIFGLTKLAEIGRGR